MDLPLRSNHTSFTKKDCGACSKRISKKCRGLFYLCFATISLAMIALFLAYSTRIIRKSILKKIIDFDYDYLYTYRMILMQMGCKHTISSLIARFLKNKKGW